MNNISGGSLNTTTGECPYCGESIELLIDETEVGQTYIEDCFVCCRPIQIHLQAEYHGGITVNLYHENEVPGA